MKPARALWLGLALGSSCVAEERHEAWIGPHVTYQWSESLEPCAGTFTYVDGFLPFAADQLGIDLDAIPDLTYRYMTAEEIVRSPVVAGAGVALGPIVLANAPAERHELLHLVETARYTLRSPRFITEGLAVAFEDRTVGPVRFHREDPRPYLTQGYLEGYDFYEPAGAFVAYLLSMYGAERLLELYSELSVGAREDSFARVFAAVYGLDFDAEVERYLDLDECPEGASAIPIPYECEAPTIPWGGADRWEYARILACEDDDVVGSPESMRTAVTLDVDVAGEYEVAVVGDPVDVLLFPCGPCPWLARNGVVTRVERFALATGRHALYLHASDRAAVAVSIRRL